MHGLRGPSPRPPPPPPPPSPPPSQAPYSSLPYDLSHFLSPPLLVVHGASLQAPAMSYPPTTTTTTTTSCFTSLPASFSFPGEAFVNSSVKLEPAEPQHSAMTNVSNLTCASGDGSGSSSGDPGPGDGGLQQHHQQQRSSSSAAAAAAAAAAPGNGSGQTAAVKKKRSLPGMPDPDAEVVALSPATLLATNRFVCEICNKGFQRDQNLQLHRRGHNLPWKLRQRSSKEIKKKVYICPEPTCVHHEPSRALGDLTGIKKHFSRKHGEKKWKCDKCSKRYAVQSDWKAHSKTCGTREYRCDCGTLFSRRDSFITHRAFCDALAEENARVSSGGSFPGNNNSAFGVQSGGPFNMMNAPSSPGNLARLGGPCMDSFSSSLRAGVSESASSLSEHSLSLLSPRWDQMNASVSAIPSSRQRLSLWLGTGPSPGRASCNEQLFGSSQGFAIGSSAAYMSPMNSHSGQEGTATAGIRDAGIGQSASITDIGALVGLSEYPTLANWPERGLNDRLQHMGSAGVGRNAPPGPAALPSPSSLSNHAHSSTAQMSATALLQKAAQMGATASNSSVLKGFGMVGLDSSSGAFGSPWPAPSLDGERGGMPGRISCLTQSQPLMRRPSSVDLGEMESPNGLGGDTSTDTAGLPELWNSSPAGFGLLRGARPIPLGFAGNVGGMVLPGSRATHQPTSFNETQTNSLQNHGVSRPPIMGGSMAAAFGGLPKVEDGAADRLTRDFLGVGGVTSIVGAAGGIGKSLSHRDLASIISAGMDQYNNPRENFKPL